MSIHYNKQSQFELFPDAPGAHIETRRTGFFRTTLTVSLDHLVVISIGVTMFLVVAYSLGIERGKFVVRLKERPTQFKTISMLIAPKPIVVTKVILRPVGIVTNPGQVVPNQTPFASTASPLNVNSTTKLPLRSGVLRTAPVNQPQVFVPRMTTTAQGGNLPRTVNLLQPGVSSKPLSALKPSGAPRPQIVQAALSVPLPVMPNQFSVVRPGASPSTVAEKKVDKGFTVQVASYANVQEGQRAVAGLKKRGMDATLMPKGKYMILCVGNFIEKIEAQDASRKLKRQFKDCVIRSL